MRIIRYIDRPLHINSPVVALGNFDGLHVAHRELISRAVKYANKIKGTPVVFTFYPHPVKVLRAVDVPLLIQTFKDKACMMMELGINTIIAHRFSKEFASLTPEEFVHRFLIDFLDTKAVFVGYDYTFGAGGMGNTETLKEMSHKLGFEVEIVPPICVEGSVVSSSKIRELLRAGNIKEANTMLGYRYFISGSVRKGSGRGRKLGFPTANVYPQKEIALRKGVYASYVYLNGKQYPAAANVGKNPTFGGETNHVEVFILNFSGSLYGTRIRVEFIEFLRNEEKFNGIEELKKAIHRDIETIKRVV